MENNARFKDTGLSYLLCLIFVLCISAVLASIVSTVANSEGVDVNLVANRNWVTYLNYFLSEIIFVLVFLIIVFISKNKNFVNTYKIKFKFDIKIFLGVSLLGIIVMLCSLNITNAINLGLSNISTLPLSNEIGLNSNNFWQYLLLVFFLALLPSICEEFVFRGIIFNGLRSRFSLVTSVIFSSLMFMLIHFSIYKCFYQIILGGILALLVYCTGTIFYGIVFHFMNNFTIVTLGFIFGNKSIFEFSSYGVREVLLSIVIFLVGAIIVFLFFKFINKYTNKHKNYFNLDKTTQPLEYIKVDETSLTYEENLLYNNKKNEGIGLFIVSIVLVAILWSFNSFGGFI